MRGKSSSLVGYEGIWKDEDSFVVPYVPDMEIGNGARKVLGSCFDDCFEGYLCLE